jgi:hypothetical protein
MLTTGSRTYSYKIYMLAFQAMGLLILFLIMLNFPNSSLILLVVHSIYKTFVENKMTQNRSPTLDAKNTMFVLQGLRSSCNYNKHQHSKLDM